MERISNLFNLIANCFQKSNNKNKTNENEPLYRDFNTKESPVINDSQITPQLEPEPQLEPKSQLELEPQLEPVYIEPKVEEPQTEIQEATNEIKQVEININSVETIINE